MSNNNTNKNQYNNRQVINNLRSLGYGVRVTHYRHFIIDDKIMSLPQYCVSFLANRLLAKGGRTEVSVFDPKNKKYFKGWADCSLNDVFNKKEGLKIALDRVMKAKE